MREKSEGKIVFSEEIPSHLQTFFYELDELREENKRLRKELEQAIYWKVDYEKSYKQAETKRDELLEENKKLEEEVDRLTNLVDRLHVDCVYYENHREPKDEGDEVENTECPF